MKTAGTTVAHALLRAVSALLPTPCVRTAQRRRHEYRRGTQECVRHVPFAHVFEGACATSL